jgi:hypothetical protein
MPICITQRCYHEHGNKWFNATSVLGCITSSGEELNHK